MGNKSSKRFYDVDVGTIKEEELFDYADIPSCYKLEKVMIEIKPIMKLVYNVFVFLVNLC